MATKDAKAQPAVVDDLRTLRDALDAPARAKAEAEAREREAEQRAYQDGLLNYARRIVTDLEPAVAAWAAWAAAPVDMQALRQTFGELVPVWRASDNVNTGSAPIADAARVAGEAAKLVTELARPGLLPPARLAAILTALERAAGHAEGFPAIYGAWTRVRQDGVALLPAIRTLLDTLERRWTPTAAELALLREQQQRLADAAKAMPPIPPTAPRRAIPGADFDATAPAVSRRGPLLENTFED
jgi:hypothetical protein